MNAVHIMYTGFITAAVFSAGALLYQITRWRCPAAGSSDDRVP